MGGVEVDSPPPYGVQDGPDRLNSLLMPHLRLAYICRRRMYSCCSPHIIFNHTHHHNIILSSPIIKVDGDE